jgi:hypothetical protein
MIPLSVLDLSPITEGGDAGQALRNSLDLARHVEVLGYERFWMAEHHNLPGIASAATAVALAHVAAGTNTIRIGAGGIMLPNHAPLLIAEQFGTLAALHPGRVELGLGRAPGSDQVTARAVRRALLGGAENFPQDVVELMAYFRPAEPGQAVQAVPGAGLEVPIWILGSSLYGAGCSVSGPAVRLRLAFRAGDDDGGDGDLPGTVPSVRTIGFTQHHARDYRCRGGVRSGSAVSLLVIAAVDAEQQDRAARPSAAASRGFRGAARSLRPRDPG